MVVIVIPIVEFRILKNLKRTFKSILLKLPLSLVDITQWIETIDGKELKKHMIY